MCTVSFVPLGGHHFFLTSNRDEAKERGLASAPKIFEKGKCKLVCPVDPFASGTWIAASDGGDAICLLNGAFEKHKRQLPYRMSRGLVVMDYFSMSDPEKFNSAYDLTNIEPFTLVMVHRRNGIRLFELRWDGQSKYFHSLDASRFHLWSSATLYSNETASQKKTAFEELLSNEKEIHAETLITLHRRFLYEDWVKPPERVNMVSTLSVTCIGLTDAEMEMHYRDLVRKELPMEKIKLSSDRKS
jgi:uncharacterized protein with NRDE domain